MTQRIHLAITLVNAILDRYTSRERAEIISSLQRDDRGETTLDRDAVVSALVSTGGHIGKAAAVLNCSRRTLQNRMREYELPTGHAGRKKL